MNDLLKLALHAHGGLNHWSLYTKVYALIHVDGILFTAKGQCGVINEGQVELELREQHGRYIGFDRQPGLDAWFEPDRITFINKGEVIEALSNPRASFRDHIFETPWTKLQLTYFGICSLWAYLTMPFHCTLSGFRTREIEPWHEAGETWRRLHVTYPDRLAYHTREQIYFFDEKGMVKRLDYQIDINEKVTAAHYVFDYQHFQGIRLPTRHLIYPRDEQGHYIREPLVLRYDLREIRFT